MINTLHITNQHPSPEKIFFIKPDSKYRETVTMWSWNKLNGMRRIHTPDRQTSDPEQTAPSPLQHVHIQTTRFNSLETSSNRKCLCPLVVGFKWSYNRVFLSKTQATTRKLHQTEQQKLLSWGFFLCRVYRNYAKENAAWEAEIRRRSATWHATG